ncbi:molybdopterin molybdotransferase MoeA [Orrella daihaiensis]|uniref:Molybdopterin molybdenumtransferase n=2 Tax=Orrella daihaiensis TaxID=2782176 RepID=A0ABY4AMJ0_9BURK|nr:molybdopterin molybdotransferase MoeA [Orrella daihaiensis]
MVSKSDASEPIRTSEIGSGLLAFDAALAKLLSRARRPVKVSQVPLLQAQDRVLAAPVISSMNVPAFDNSAMDGYALNVADFAKPPESFVVIQRIAAGQSGQAIEPGEAARIFTGAPVPDGTNVVVPQEQTQVQGNRVLVNGQLRAGQHIRRAGEDVAADDVVLHAGIRLEPQHLALAASVGVAQVPVYARLRIGVLFTGDELVEPGQALGAGKIYNSNRYALHSLLARVGCDVLDFGVVTDSLMATTEALHKSARACDVIITCGGVSVGEEDWVKQAVTNLGSIDVWRIAMKPGKPLAFGRIGNADFIGLPGNPVSAFVTFLVAVMPFLRQRMGLVARMPRYQLAVAGFDWAGDAKRREFLRVRQEPGESAQAVLALWPNQGSAVVSGLVWADGLVDLEPGTRVKAGDLVRYVSLSDLMR